MTRHPWMRDEDDGDEKPVFAVYAGTASFYGADGR
jgi:hypothetical protein